MNNIKILDCTLRDGGYCNECHFGNNNIKKIIKSLIEANIDIIECGFLTNMVTYNSDITKYTSIDDVASVIPSERNGKIFVALMNYGEYSPEDLPECDESSINGLRVAFHKKDKINAIEVCHKIKAKKYKVFVQAMVSLSYTDEEFLNLIHDINELEPYAFYIVDSFGMMKYKELIRLFYLVEHNLKKNIIIGFHSHNNMQLAYSNAQNLVNIPTDRELIIDASVYGMGRGAGNLNTELFVEYLNENVNGQYTLKPLLTIIDQILSLFYQQNYWGYSLPNYLSAKHNIHPNYASYLDAKKTLTVENMDEIFSMMDKSKQFNYDKLYIEELYIKYMETGRVQEKHLTELKTILNNKNVLIIAPGKSSVDEKDKIIACAKRKNIITIAINFDYPNYNTDFIFLSNLRRYRELDKTKYPKCIVTSNIPPIDVYLQTKYAELLNTQEAVRDNAGMMLIKFLIQLSVKKIFIAGIDGYSVDLTQNFADQKMNIFTQKAIFETMNVGLNTILREYSRQIAIEFVTTPRYVTI
jgi:4-hydroxy 2-oxovalerate aldolase